MGSAAKALGTMWSQPPACTVQSAMSTSAAVLLTLHRSPDTKKVRFPLTRKRTFLRYVWSQLRDSNLRPADYESAALPTELSWHHDGSGLRCSVLQCPALFGSSRSAEKIYYPNVPRTSNTFCVFGQIFFAAALGSGAGQCAPCEPGWRWRPLEVRGVREPIPPCGPHGRGSSAVPRFPRVLCQYPRKSPASPSSRQWTGPGPGH